jgi:hypothetical protein
MDEMVKTAMTEPADLAERSRAAGGDKSAGGPLPRRGVRQGLLRHSAAAKRTAKGGRAEWTKWLRRR